MLTYVLRRILLFVPTILGATLLVFALMHFAPVSITDTVLPPDGQMKPGEREQREAILNERFGLGDPFFKQYLRWLNNASPLGLQIWRYDDPLVIEKRAERRAWRAAREPEVRAANPDLREPQVIEELNRLQEEAEAAGEVDFTPKPGQFRFDKVPIKAPDLGYSIIWQRPAADLILERLPITLLLNFISTPLALLVSIATGVWSARHRGKWQDWGTGFILLALYSIPVIWAGIMMIGFLANEQFPWLRWFPPGEVGSLAAAGQPFFPNRDGGDLRPGAFFDAVWHLILPVVCLTYAQFAYLSKLTRTSMLEVLGSDFVRTARAKGLPESVVTWRHGFRNAVAPIITVLAALLPSMIVGSVVVERIFTIDGMGSLVVESLLRKDFLLFLSITLVTLILTIVSYLIADIAYAIADPRVSYE